MKRLSKIVMSVVAVCVLTFGSMLNVGCDLEESQIKVIAQNAGLFSAVGWIAVDNPTPEAINSVKTVLVVVKEKAQDVASGSTYTETLYPILIKVINTEIDPQYRPICKAGTLSLLGGIDLMFAANPTWDDEQEKAVSIVSAFVLGADNGLSMKESDPVMVQARSTAGRRARVYIGQ